MWQIDGPSHDGFKWVCSHCQIVEDVLESRTQELAKTLETTEAVLADTGRMFVLENRQRKALEAENAALKLEWSRLSGIAAERDKAKAELDALQDRAEIMEEALVEYHRLNNDRRLAGHPYDSSAFALAERARPVRSE